MNARNKRKIVISIKIAKFSQRMFCFFNVYNDLILMIVLKMKISETLTHHCPKINI